MPDIHGFVERHFLSFFLFCAASVTLGFAWSYYRYRRHGVSFPDITFQRVCFSERAASGCSFKSLWTRLGGARNCLTVIVTDSEVWIRPAFPFIVFAHEFDLVHRIPRNSIASVEAQQSLVAGKVVLAYRDADGGSHRLALHLRDSKSFMRVLQPENPPQ